MVRFMNTNTIMFMSFESDVTTLVNWLYERDEYYGSIKVKLSMVRSHLCL